MVDRTALIIQDPTITRATVIGSAIARALKDRGWKVHYAADASAKAITSVDLIAGYGWGPIMSRAGVLAPDRTLHIDLGFWNRKPPGNVLGGYHKLAIGGRWPNLEAFWDADLPADRLRDQGVTIADPREPGNRVLICGMSEKAARTFGYAPEEWERDAIARLLEVGAVPIYRPKPSWPGARPIVGAKYHDPTKKSLGHALASVNAVATHHGNTAADGLAAGLPIFCQQGVVRPLSVNEIGDLVGATAYETPVRASFLRQLAWHQWNVDEIERGAWLEPPAPLAKRPIFRR